MIKYKYFIQKESFWIIFIFLAILSIYSPLILTSNFINPDAAVILNNLDSNQSFLEYLLKLIQFKTIDFQPLRDLSLFIDLFFFKNFQINTFILQNTLLWVFACYWVWRILNSIFIERDKIVLILLTLAFTVYPLFSYTISWGIARKHILSFLFILLSTYEIINLKELKAKNLIKVEFFYLLSVLSQPINILWPFWAIIYLVFFKKINLFIILKKFSLILITFLVFICINFFYYRTSPSFQLFYSSNTHNLFDFPAKLLALGHYSFQIFFPYSLAFSYDLGNQKVLFGLGLLTIFFLSLYKFSLLKRTLPWITLGAAPLIVVLGNPEHLFDSYLLMPTLSILIVVAFLIPKEISNRGKSVIILISCFFIYSSHRSAKKWSHPLTLIQESFKNRPNCKHARNYLNTTYDYAVMPSQDLKNYLRIHDCLRIDVSSPVHQSRSFFLISKIMFFEESIPLNTRIENLRKLSHSNVLIHLNLVALLIKESRYSEADQELKTALKTLKQGQFEQKYYHYQTAKFIHPYCEEKKWVDCLLHTKKFISRIRKPYLI